jgi:linoleoyl-CoA desaturase
MAVAEAMTQCPLRYFTATSRSLGTARFLLAGIGFNIGHDAIHGSYSANPLINKLMSGGFEFIGACTYTWRIRHNLIHHTYTNIVGSDGDLESMPLLRFCVKPGRKWFHRYQHFYAPFLYCFASLVWIVKKGFVHILEERRDQRLGRKPPVAAYFSLVFFKLLHLTLFLLVPYLMLGEPFWVILMGFVLMHFVAGFSLAIVFQLGHLVDGPDTIQLPTPDAITEPYAEHQLRTSANFGTGFWPTFFCGGLNYQIEHHLFPRICHIHYPALSKIVRQTAQEFDLPYHAHPNFFAGVRSHIAILKHIGRTDCVGQNF